MDVGGQEERTHKRARICPVSGPGLLSKSERTRRARAIIAESGADRRGLAGEVVTSEGDRFEQPDGSMIEALQEPTKSLVTP